jgi:hypothetical protein
MVTMKITEIGQKRSSAGRSLYYLLISCVNPETNRIEINGRAMNTLDLCAYANVTRQELNCAMRTLYNENVIINIRAKDKDFYYINPEFACDPETPACLLDWLTVLFQQEENCERKELVYFDKSRKGININIGKLL